MTINPSSGNGLIFYVGDATGNVDFMSLSLLNGAVQLRYNLGSGPAPVANLTVAVTLNEWHIIEISRTGKTASLSVDGVTSTQVTVAGTSTQLNPGSTGVYLGGIEDSSMFSSYAGSEMSFRGCIESLRVNRVYKLFIY